jgi:outer membrane protein TolC
MKRTAVLLICILAVSVSGAALTLDEAVSYAVSKNRNVLAAKEKIQSARGKVVETRAGFLPSLSLQGSYNYLSLVPAFEIQSPGPLGQTITRMTYLGANDNWLYRASVSQTLFAWGRVSNQYDAAKLNLEAAEQEYRRVVAETVHLVVNAYYSAVLADKFQELAVESLKRIADHLKAVRDKFAVGAASQFELLRSSVQVLNYAPVASKAKNALELSIISLKNVIGIGLDDGITLDTEIPFEPAEYRLDALLKEAFTSRPEVIQAGLRKETARRYHSAAKAGNMPLITGAASYNYQNPFYNKVEWTYNWSAGVALNFPLFDGMATSGRMKQTRSELRQAEIAEDNVRRGVEVEVRQAFLSVREAAERVDSQKGNLAQAEESLRIAEVSYANGAATNLEVMDAQLALNQAKTNYLQALFDYRIAQAALLKAVGRNYGRESASK